MCDVGQHARRDAQHSGVNCAVFFMLSDAEHGKNNRYMAFDLDLELPDLIFSCCSSSSLS